MRDATNQTGKGAWPGLPGADCSIARALEILGERWPLLIVRDAFLDVRRFDAFGRKLGVGARKAAHHQFGITDVAFRAISAGGQRGVICAARAATVCSSEGVSVELLTGRAA